MSRLTIAPAGQRARTSITPPPLPTSLRGCAAGRCTVVGGECEEYHDPESTLQRTAVDGPIGPVRGGVFDVLGSPGRPLDPTARTFMESRFDRDFSRVRVHT